MRVLQIVPHLPPPYEGVGTYAAALAGELAGADRFLVGDPPGAGGGNGAAAVSARTAAALLEGIGEAGTVLLHYANYGYQARGCPAWLVAGMARWRGRLVTLFHEVHASGPPWRSSFWLRPAQRRLAAALARRSDALVTTLDLYAGLLRPWTGGREITVLPVFSTVGEPPAVPPFGERARRLVVFGGAGVRGRAYGPFLPALARAARALAAEEIWDVGPPLPLPAAAGGVPIRPLGVLPAAEVRRDPGRLGGGVPRLSSGFSAEVDHLRRLLRARSAPHLCLGGPADRRPPLLAGGRRRSRGDRRGGPWLVCRPFAAAPGRALPEPPGAMRILVYSPAFLPGLGGLELATAQLAGQLHQAGHEVTVLTTTAARGEEGAPFRVVRRPSPAEALRWTRWCDVFYQANVSLRGLWPLLLVRRPWVVSHHSWYRRTEGRIAWQDRLKRRLLRFAASSIAVSQAVADDLSTPSVVIPNTYRDDLFRRLPEVERTGDLAFLGRLVTDKGVDVLLDALALLAAEGLRPRLTVIGDGPEAPRLREQAVRLGLGGQVDFLGERRGEELVQLLNRHRILVVPSRYDEPFGIVALEGIACGCVVVGSEGGGLKAAIGPCGETFHNGDAADLARVLGRRLRRPELDAEPLRHAGDHLARHSGERVAAAYLRELEGAARQGRPRA